VFLSVLEFAESTIHTLSIFTNCAITYDNSSSQVLSKMRLHSGSLSSFPAVLRPFLPSISNLSDPRRMLAVTAPMLARSRRRTTQRNQYRQPTHGFNTAWYKPLLKQYAWLIQQLRVTEKENVALLNEKAKRVRVEENFNIRGAIESIVHRAKEVEKKRFSGGIQAGINKMAKQQGFKTALNCVVQERGLVLGEVVTCVRNVYHELSKHAHGNNGTIVIRHEDHTRNEVAALVTIFKAQRQGPGALAWREEAESEMGGGRCG
ncbi:hypothetical protein HOY80DRAFT_1107981, partial [Tuber brumale]